MFDFNYDDNFEPTHNTKAFWLYTRKLQAFDVKQPRHPHSWNPIIEALEHNNSALLEESHGTTHH